MKLKWRVDFLVDQRGACRLIKLEVGTIFYENITDFQLKVFLLEYHGNFHFQIDHFKPPSYGGKDVNEKGGHLPTICPTVFLIVGLNISILALQCF